MYKRVFVYTLPAPVISTYFVNHHRRYWNRYHAGGWDRLRPMLPRHDVARALHLCKRGDPKVCTYCCRYVWYNIDQRFVEMAVQASGFVAVIRRPTNIPGFVPLTVFAPSSDIRGLNLIWRALNFNITTGAGNGICNILYLTSSDFSKIK